jgi:hypothetical protein
MQVTDSYWALKHTPSGAIVAKFDQHRPRTIPDAIAGSDAFSVVTVADRQELNSLSVDQTALTETDEKQLAEIYPILD